MIVLSGQSNPELAQRIADQLGCIVGGVKYVVFDNGENKPVIEQPISGEDVCIVQSLAPHVHDRFMELLLLINAAQHADAKRVIVIIPWMAYSLQNNVFVSGEPLSSQVIAQALSSSGCSHIILVHLHDEKIQSYFSVPVTELSVHEILAKEAKKEQADVVVAPDRGGLHDANILAQTLQLPLAMIEKQRNRETGEVHAVSISGEVKGKTCILVDDVINTGGTAVKDANILKEHGAARILFYATHGVFAGKAVELLEKSVIDRIVITDTIHNTQHALKKLSILSIANKIADTVHSVSQRA